jgi:adenylosuccinate lyase
MFFLGKTMGKQIAHTLIYETSMAAVETGEPMLDVLMQRPEIAGTFSRKEILRTMLPENHVGMSRPLTRRTIDQARNQLKNHENIQTGRKTCPLATENGTCCR